LTLRGEKYPDMDRVTFPRQVEEDAVTGMPPRKILDHDIPMLLRSMGTAGLPLCAIMIDIDHFKKLNDKHGHDVGDLVLRHVASTVRKAVRFRGEAYRYGGEEITVLMLNTSLAEGAATAERLCRAVENSRVEAVVQGEKREFSVQISLGVASTEQVSGSELIVSADQALLVAKETGRNHAEVYDKARTRSGETTRIDVTFFGTPVPIQGNNYILLKKWYAIDNPLNIGVLEMKDLDHDATYVGDKNMPLPSGGLLEAEIRGKVKEIEVRSNRMFFKLEVRNEVIDLMFKYIQDSGNAGY